MSSLRVLSRNIFSNWLGYFIHAVTSLLLTPYILSSLGESRFGIWALVTGVTGYYGLLDAGFRVGITRFLTRYRAKGDYEKMNRTASTGFVALLICASFLSIVTTVLAFAFPYLFNIEADLYPEVFWAILIVGLSTAGQFIFFVFSAVFAATQRYEVSNAIGVSTRVLSVILIVTFVNLGYGLVGVCAAGAIANLFDYLVRWRIAKLLLPQLSVRPGMANWASAWEFLHFSIWNMATDASRQIIYNTDAVIIGIFLTPAAIANYALAVTICNQLLQLFKPMGAVFFPYFTELEAKGQIESIRTVYLNGTKFLVTIALAVGVIGFIWADDFYRLWIGDRISESDAGIAVSTIFRLLIFSTILAASQRVGAQLLIAMGRIKLQAMLIVSEALLNLVLSILLVPYFGLVGVAVGTLLPAILFQGLVHPAVICGYLEIRMSEFLWRVVAGPLAMAMILVPACVAVRLSLAATGWFRLGLSGLVAAALAAVLAFLFVLNREERAKLVRFSTARLRQLARLAHRF